MRICGVLFLGLLSAACGGPEDDPAASPEDDRPCDSCGTPITPVAERPRIIAQHVAVEPAELLFYGELSDTAIPPEYAEVFNRTSKPVAIVSAYVTDDPDKIYGQGGASFFEVSGLPETAVLAAGESLRLEVSFAGSSGQRAALLVIETTDTDDASLVVELSGKLFSTSTGF